MKRELWGIVSVIKSDRDYLIGTEVIIETNCLPILGMISGCNTPDIAMLRWITYIKSLNLEIRHVAGKHNVVADMLSRARYDGEEDRHSDEDDVGLDCRIPMYNGRIHTVLFECPSSGHLCK